MLDVIHFLACVVCGFEVLGPSLWRRICEFSSKERELDVHLALCRTPIPYKLLQRLRSSGARGQITELKFSPDQFEVFRPFYTIFLMPQLSPNLSDIFSCVLLRWCKQLSWDSVSPASILIYVFILLLLLFIFYI